MQWNIQQLEKRAQIYNRIYFNNEIELPIRIRWSRHLYNTDSRFDAYCRSNDEYHLIRFNVKYSNVSDEIMRSTLVHEMIHAWQDEHDPNCNDDWATYEGHGPSFIKKCEELNAKFKFTYPLMRYTQGSKLANIEKQNKDVYFVYRMATSEKLDPNAKFPVGVFVKFLYRDEIVNLVNKGVLVKYYTNARFSDKTCYPDIDNKYVTQTDIPVTYTRLKNYKSGSFVQFIKDEFGLYHMASDDDFNFKDGMDVEL